MNTCIQVDDILVEGSSDVSYAPSNTTLIYFPPFLARLNTYYQVDDILAEGLSDVSYTPSNMALIYFPLFLARLNTYIQVQAVLLEGSSDVSYTPSNMALIYFTLFLARLNTYIQVQDVLAEGSSDVSYTPSNTALRASWDIIMIQNLKPLWSVLHKYCIIYCYHILSNLKNQQSALFDDVMLHACDFFKSGSITLTVHLVAKL